MRKALLVFLAVLVLGPAMAGETAIPDRLDQIKVGEWVLMQDVSGGDRAGETNRITVVKADDDSITFRREHYAADGSLIDSKDRDMEKANMRERAAGLQQKAKSIEPGVIMVKDKEIPVVAVAFESEDRDNPEVTRDFIIWVSSELPASGVAKTWCSDADFPQAEVIDYGF